MRYKPLETEDIKVFITEFSDYLQKNAGIQPEKYKMFRVETLDQRDTVLIMADFAGDMEGKVFLGFDDTTACLAAEDILRVQNGESRSFDRASDKVKAVLLDFTKEFFSRLSVTLKEKEGRTCTISEIEFCELREAKVNRKYAMIPFTVSGLSQMHLFLSLQAVKKVEQSGKRRIVVVDDSKNMRDMLEKMLEKANYHVVGEFANGAQALGKLEELSPELVLLNIDIPGVAGTRMLASMRAAYPSAKVVVMTGEADKETIMQCLHNGASTCILKPFQPDRFIETVTRVLYLP
ncbi:MAG: response regulator [Nitrospirota bacterium]|nr:response regulator [Nitrospirota bacterium]